MASSTGAAAKKTSSVTLVRSASHAAIISSPPSNLPCLVLLSLFSPTSTLHCHLPSPPSHPSPPLTPPTPHLHSTPRANQHSNRSSSTWLCGTLVTQRKSLSVVLLVVDPRLIIPETALLPYQPCISLTPAPSPL